MPVSYLVILLEGQPGQPPTAETASAFAEVTGATVPITADPTQQAAVAMPFQGVIPGKCVLSPQMEILTCYSGTDDSQGVDAIAAHAAM